MTKVEPPEGTSSAWRWPAEWAGERAFWREVAARTIAGVFTLVIVAVPALIYAGTSGALTVDQVAPILIGVGIFLVLLVLYVLILGVITRAERRKVARALHTSEEQLTGPLPTVEQLGSYSNAQREEIEEARKQARRRTLLASGATILGAVLGGVAPFL